MVKYKKVYCDYFGYGEDDYIPSEISGSPAVDIHHILCKGMGGSKEMDYIENLIALTREEHLFFGDKKQHIAYLKEVHFAFMNQHKNQ